MKKITFNDYEEPAIGSDELNQMQENIENAIGFYSTSETKIETPWINGKPRYRKVITVSNIRVVYQVAISHGIANLDEITSKIGLYTDASGSVAKKYQFPFVVDGTNNLFDFWVGPSGLNITCTNTSAEITANANRKYTFIIEYTKTTD